MFLLKCFLEVVGTNNITSNAQRNKAQRSFQQVKAQHKMRNLFFLIFKAQRNFRNDLFDLVVVQRNSTIAKRHFCTKLKRNLTSAIEISKDNANTAYFAIFDRKRANNLLRRPTFYQNSDRNGTNLS